METKMKKGDAVWLISSWDNKGTFHYSPWVVRSAGAQQIHLVSDDGENLHKRIYTSTESKNPSLFPRSIDPVIKGTELAAAYLVAARALLESRIGNPSYNQNGIVESINNLHAPRVEHYDVLAAEIS